MEISVPGVDEDPVPGIRSRQDPGEQFRREIFLWGVQREGEEAVVQAARLKEGGKNCCQLDAGHAGVFRKRCRLWLSLAAAQGGTVVLMRTLGGCVSNCVFHLRVVPFPLPKLRRELSAP